MNRVILSGRLTSDPDIRATGSGLTIAAFSVAVDEWYKGEKRTSFFDVTAFGRTAEMLRDMAQKGTRVGLEGTLRQERWESREGEKRSKVAVVAQRVEFYDRYRSANSNSGSSYETNNNFRQNSSNNYSNNNAAPDVMDYYGADNNQDFLNGNDDIPF